MNHPKDWREEEWDMKEEIDEEYEAREEKETRMKDRCIRVQTEEQEEEAESEEGKEEEDIDGWWDEEVESETEEEAEEEGQVSGVSVRRKEKGRNGRKAKKRAKGKGPRPGRKPLPSSPKQHPKKKTSLRKSPAGIRGKKKQFPYMVVRSIRRNGRIGMKIIVWHPSDHPLPKHPRRRSSL
jgi:hypothetical protein